MSNNGRAQPNSNDHAADRLTSPLGGRAEEIFADARAMQLAALGRLTAGDLRDAAEKAWCATLRATDGLIVARTGREPQKSPTTTRMLRSLGGSDPAVRRLSGRYFISQGALHGDCFYLGLCEPADDTERLIRETIDYIDDAEQLASA